MHIHIVSITGMMTAPLALELKRQGHNVTGSDQEKIYPPFSLLLEKAGIPVNQTPINNDIDLAIIGAAYTASSITTQAFEDIKKQGIKFISATEYLASHVVRPESILVAGSFGKTTISCLLSWIFTCLDLNPSYFFGSQSVNGIDSMKMTDSQWSILEAGEDFHGLETKAKFLYYPSKYVILTSTLWEHKDVYKSEADNIAAYQQLINNIPANGILVYNPSDSSVNSLLKSAVCKTVPYRNDFSFMTQIIGKHNLENISAALTLCSCLNLDMDKVIGAVSEFKGVTRRLEVIDSQNGILFIDDFAQSAPRVKSAIEAVASTYPDRPIKVYFEPTASFLQNIISIAGFKQAFLPAQEVVLAQLKYNKIDKSVRATAPDWQKEVGSKLKYLPLNDDIYNHFLGTLSPDDILIHFSSGGLDGINLTRNIAKHFNKLPVNQKD